MNDKTKAFWLGLFIVATIGLLAALVIFLKPSVGNGEVELKVLFSNIDKISKGTLVAYAGKPVGEVVSIQRVKHPHEARADSAGNLYVYELTLQVDSSVKIYSYDEIVFSTAGLLGEKSISILPKATPKGSAPAENISSEILYAQSIDRFDQTLSQLSSVATTLQGTLQEISGFFQTTQPNFNLALQSLTRTSNQFELFFDKTRSSEMAEKLALASDHLRLAANAAQRVFLTLETTTLIPQLEETLNNINQYGLLYQFDRKWKRKQLLEKRCCTEIPCESYCKIN